MVLHRGSYVPPVTALVALEPSASDDEITIALRRLRPFAPADLAAVPQSAAGSIRLTMRMLHPDRSINLAIRDSHPSQYASPIITASLANVMPHYSPASLAYSLPGPHTARRQKTVKHACTRSPPPGLEPQSRAAPRYAAVEAAFKVVNNLKDAGFGDALPLW